MTTRKAASRKATTRKAASRKATIRTQQDHLRTRSRRRNRRTTYGTAATRAQPGTTGHEPDVNRDTPPLLTCNFPHSGRTSKKVPKPAQRDPTTYVYVGVASSTANGTFGAVHGKGSSLQTKGMRREGGGQNFAAMVRPD